ncbi:MAG: hypothetical protein LWW97_00480 [Deltaproteobacteria bacterium]|nr:hypothetical protein [Deltaproteobacteria bacterium]
MFKLLINRLVPIIAHSERNLEIQQMPNKINGLIQKGALTQLNAGSLSGTYPLIKGIDAAEKIIGREKSEQLVSL